MGKPRLSLDDLTPGDLRRAEAALGRDPWALLDGGSGSELDRLVLVIWCLRSREDPSFTWEQAEATPFGAFTPGGPPRDPAARRAWKVAKEERRAAFLARADRWRTRALLRAHYDLTRQEYDALTLEQLGLLVEAMKEAGGG